MGKFYVLEGLYGPRQGIGKLKVLKELADRVGRRSTDSYDLQGKCLDEWSKKSGGMGEFLFRRSADIKKYQLIKIQNLVSNAFKNVPFYHDLYSACGYEVGCIEKFSDFERLPVVTKDHLNSVDPRDRVNDPDLVDIANTSRTSGSSGKPFTVYSDDDDIILDHLQVMRFYSTSLKRPLQENDWVYMLHHSGLAFSSLHGKYRTFQLPDLLPDTPLGEHLLLLRPRLIVTLPSYLPLILKHKVAVKMSGVEAILTNSESSTHAERNYYSMALGVPVLDEYSSEEIGMIATQCAQGQYHVIEDGVYLEIVGADTHGFGSVVCTDLNNELMPLIRFDHGDVAKKSSLSTLCACGCMCSSIDEINGRRDDAFLTRDHVVVPSASVLAAVDDILITPDRTLRKFRVVQKSSELVELLTHYVGQPYKKMADIVDDFEQRLSCLFGYPIQVVHRDVDVFPMQKSYKRRCIVREWGVNALCH